MATIKVKMAKATDKVVKLSLSTEEAEALFTYLTRVVSGDSEEMLLPLRARLHSLWADGWPVEGD